MLCIDPFANTVKLLARGAQGEMERRLEDQIRKLCAEVVNTPDADEWDEIILELNTALREHIRRARKPLTEFAIQEERRSAS
jgi:hypothetical protein